MDLRANTAVDVLIGPFLDSTNGNDEENALTLLQADIQLSKNGQTLAEKSDTTSAAFDAKAMYNCELDVTDLNTEGNLVLVVHKSGALYVRHEYNVLSEAAFDSLYAAKDTGFMDVNISSTDDIDLSDTQKASVNTEVDVALNVTTYAQPGQEAPAATTTIRLMIAYLYKMIRNETRQTLTEFSLLNSGATVVDQKRTVSDAAGTATKEELESGP